MVAGTGVRNGPVRGPDVYLCGRDRLTGRGGKEAAHLIGSTGGSVRWIGMGWKNDLESDPASR